MNFFDSYDVGGTSTPPPAQEATPSLDEEVSQVVGQLSRFWGGFRKQSQTVLETARKDLGEFASQAQKEINKFTAETLAAPTSPGEGEASATGDAPEGERSEEAENTPAESSTAASVEGDSESSTTPMEQPSQPQTIFSRLQSSLPPNLVSDIQNRLPDSLKHARIGSLSTLDFEQLRSTLTSEVRRVQDATGEYVKQSEELLREAGEFLKDAVKVLPPEEGAATPGVVWDGTDVWMLPTPTDTPASRKGKERESRSSSSSGRPSADTLRAVATRAESMLKQLKHDPEVVKVDPQADERIKQMFDDWAESRVDSEEGGINSERWKNATERALAEPVDGAALNSTFEVLVPSEMTSDVFWTRYFFRVYQVEQEEERRKAILQGAADNDEDFSWEDDDDDTTSKLPPAQPTSAPVEEHLHETASSADTTAPPTLKRGTTTSTPGNQSESEDSYDVVSSTVSESKAQSPARGEDKAKEEDEGGEESDWE